MSHLTEEIKPTDDLTQKMINFIRSLPVAQQDQAENILSGYKEFVPKRDAELDLKQSIIDGQRITLSKQWDEIQLLKADLTASQERVKKLEEEIELKEGLIESLKRNAGNPF